MTQDRSVKAEIERLTTRLRALAAQRQTESREANHAGNQEMDAYRDGQCMALKDCIYELESLLSALIAEAPQVQKEQGDTRVDGPKVMPSSGSTAAENQTKDATVTPNQVSNVLRELDSYRRVIREAFEEGYAASSDRMPIEHAWDRSEARQAEWSFAHTRMSVGAVVGNQQPRSDAVDQVAPRGQEGPTRDKSSPRSAPATAENRWKVSLACCGRDAGAVYFPTWEAAYGYRFDSISRL